MKTGQFGLNVNRARGVNMAPYARDMDTGRPFGASGQPFRQEDPGASKPDYGGMLPELEKQMMEEKFRRQGR